MKRKWFFHHQTYSTEQSTPTAHERMQFQMSTKRNVVLYLDNEIVAKSKELGFNLSKTFENHLKQLITHFNNLNLQKISEIKENGGSPEAT